MVRPKRSKSKQSEPQADPASLAVKAWRKWLVVRRIAGRIPAATLNESEIARASREFKKAAFDKVWFPALAALIENRSALATLCEALGLESTPLWQLDGLRSYADEKDLQELDRVMGAIGPLAQRVKTLRQRRGTRRQPNNRSVGASSQKVRTQKLKKENASPPLSVRCATLLHILASQLNGVGLSERELANELRRRSFHVGPGTIRTHDIPRLRKHASISRVAAQGYFIPTDEREHALSIARHFGGDRSPKSA